MRERGAGTQNSRQIGPSGVTCLLLSYPVRMERTAVRYGMPSIFVEACASCASGLK